MSDPAFSSIARNYDATFTNTTIGRLQRSVVWEMLAKQVMEGPTVLELNCGTGTDAVWMAKRGWRVLATDISPEMIQVTQEKLAQSGAANTVATCVCGFADIALLKEGPFDLIFSNFGGINCIPEAELKQLFEQLRTKLTPNGQIMAVVMGRFCWWETLYFLLTGKPSQAFRRFSRDAVQAQLDVKTTVATWYYSPRSLKNVLSGYKVELVRPVGFWLPPSYLEPFFTKRPQLLHLLTILEKKYAPSLLASAADHFFIAIRPK